MTSFWGKIKEFTSHRGFKKYGINTSWLIFERSIRIILGITIGVWVARYLGPENFGILNFAESFVGILSALGLTCLEDIIVREVLKNKNQRNVIMGTAFILKMGGFFLILLLSGIFISITNYSQKTNLIILIISSSFFFRSFTVIIAHFTSEVLSKYIVISNLISLIISSLLRIWLILNAQNVVFFALVILFDFSLASFLYYLFYLKSGHKARHWKVDFSLAKKILVDCWPLVLGGIIIFIHTKTDRIMLKEMIGNTATGHYAAAVRVNETIFYLFAIIVSSLLPAIVNAKERCQLEYKNRLQKIADFTIIFFLFFSIPLIFFSKEIIIFLYGKEFTASTDILKIHALCGLFVGIGVVRSKWAIVENLQRFDMIANTIGVIANISFNYVLIKKLGSIGAAYGTLCAHLFVLIFISLILKPIRFILFMNAKSFLRILTLNLMKETHQ